MFYWILWISGGLLIAYALLALALFIVVKGIKIIQQSEAMIIERLGKYQTSPSKTSLRVTT